MPITIPSPDTAPNGGLPPFSLTDFADLFDDVRPLILAEWPTLDAKALDATNADVDAIITLVAANTKHSKALVRKHLSEMAEVAGVGAVGVEARLLRLLHLLEHQLEPLQEGGRWAMEEMRQSMPQAKKKMRENLWTSMLASLGVGVLVGLVVGLTRGR